MERTALIEANQVGSLQPTILVSYSADLGPVFDTRTQGGLDRQGVTAAMLADAAWRVKMLEGQSVPTQDLARALTADRFSGLLIQSFAKGASPSDFNVVLWACNDKNGSLEVVDDEERLTRMKAARLGAFLRNAWDANTAWPGDQRNSTWLDTSVEVLRICGSV